MDRVHIIGAGLAGLAAALRLSAKNIDVVLHEATQRAGGRCRSFFDDTLGCVIDNGNHLLMGGNYAAMAYLDEIGARDRMSGPEESAFDFIDIPTDKRWTLRPNRGPFPWWVLSKDRRTPDTNLVSMIPALKLMLAGREQTVADVIDADSVLYERMLEPLTVAAINADPSDSSARLMRPVLLETFGRGAEGCRPLIAKESLADSMIDPALAELEKRGVEVRFGDRLQKLHIRDQRVDAIDFGSNAARCGSRGNVIMALPAWDVRSLIPDLAVPPAGEPIVNVHFKNETAKKDVGLIGLIGGFAQWVFTRPDTISITISAARDEAKLDAEEIAQRCWADVRQALSLDHDMPAYRVIKEKRATIAQSPEANATRPDNKTAIRNLYLAGDWTDTGLPATIESAIRSGNRAADLAAATLGR